MSAQNYEFDISNMKCGGCVSVVEAALKELSDTEVIEVSLENHNAVVITSKTAEEIADVITAAGFPAAQK